MLWFCLIDAACLQIRRILSGVWWKYVPLTIVLSIIFFAVSERRQAINNFGTSSGFVSLCTSLTDANHWLINARLRSK
jgi:hypothetical protein